MLAVSRTAIGLVAALLAAVPALWPVTAPAQSAGARPPAPQLWGGVRIVQRLPARLEFSPLRGAVRYRVVLSAREDFATRLAEDVVAMPEVPLGTMADGDYFVRVRAIGEGGLEGREATARIRVRQRAEAPRPLRPAAGARLIVGEVEFAWSRDPEAAGYVLEIAPDRGFRAPAAQRDGLSGASYVARGLAPGDYYWRVASRTRDGRLSAFSEPQPLAIRAPQPPVGRPVLDAESLHIEWPPGPGGTYELQVAADAAFTRLVAERRSDTPFASLPRPAAGVYYARIRTVEADGTAGPYSPPRQFEVPVPAPRPACLVEGPGGICAVYAPR